MSPQMGMISAAYDVDFAHAREKHLCFPKINGFVFAFSK
jgi:hypothetical protein